MTSQLGALVTFNNLSVPVPCIVHFGTEEKKVSEIYLAILGYFELFKDSPHTLISLRYSILLLISF